MLLWLGSEICYADVDEVLGGKLMELKEQSGLKKSMKCFRGKKADGAFILH